MELLLPLIRDKPEFQLRDEVLRLYTNPDYNLLTRFIYRRIWKQLHELVTVLCETGFISSYANPQYADSLNL